MKFKVQYTFQGSDVCMELECYRPHLNDCRIFSRQMAADGTQCGNKKWCYKGKCVKNDNALVAADGTALLLFE